GDRAIETDEIIWAVGCQLNLDGLNLEALGIDPKSTNINLKQQTHHPQIYICHSVEGEFALSHFSRYQTDIALHNALYCRDRRIARKGIPYSIFTDPNSTRIGLTERDAKHKYNDNVVVYQQYFKNVSRAILVEETTGLLKIILNRKGKILGATIVGAEAGELINILTLAIQNRINIDRLAELYSISPSFSEIFWQTARDWRRDRNRQNSWQNAIRHLWFDLRRRK
ncbi:MAG: mercuric reductase, partial [Spirulina sp.]